MTSQTVTQPPDISYVWGSSQACNWCSSGATFMWHNGLCPRVKAIEYHRDGWRIKRVEFFDRGGK